MTDEDVVRRFAAITECGTVHNYHRDSRKRYWRWAVQSRDDVISVLTLLMPYLGERRRAAATSVLERAQEIVPRNGERSHCKRGHSFADADNLYVDKKTGKRSCRRCRNEYRKGWTPRLAR
jgi:hypothetical protein